MKEPDRLIETGTLAPLLHEYRKRTSRPATFQRAPRPAPAHAWGLSPTLLGGLLAVFLGVWLIARAPGEPGPGGTGGFEGRSGAVHGTGGSRGNSGA